MTTRKRSPPPDRRRPGRRDAQVPPLTRDAVELALLSAVPAATGNADASAILHDLAAKPDFAARLLAHCRELGSEIADHEPADPVAVLIATQELACLAAALELPDPVRRALRALEDLVSMLPLPAATLPALARWAEAHPLPEALRLPAFDPDHLGEEDEELLDRMLAQATKPERPVPGFGPRQDAKQVACGGSFNEWYRRLRNLCGERLARHLATAGRWANINKPLAGLTRILRDPRRDVRDKGAAIEALGRHGHPIGILVLGGLATADDNDDLAVAAAKALGRSGGTLGLPFLERAAAGPAPGPARCACIALASLGHARRALPHLTDAALAADPALQAVAALARGEAATLAGIACACPEAAIRRIAADFLEQLTRPLDADSEALRLLDPATDDCEVLLAGPRLAALAPEVLATALGEDYDPEDPIAGRREWLVGLLGPAGLPVLERWLSGAHKHLTPQVLQGLAGAPERPDEGPTVAANRCLLTPQGFDRLVAMLADPALDDYQRNSLRFPLVQHRLVWPVDGAVKRRQDQALAQTLLRAELDPGHIIYLAGELRLDPLVDWLAGQLRHQAYAAWALAEIGGPKAAKALRHYATQVLHGEIDPDSDPEWRLTLLSACADLDIADDRLLDLAEVWRDTLPWWRQALHCRDLRQDGAARDAEVPPAARLAWAAWRGWELPAADADDLDQAVTLLIGADLAGIAARLLAPLEEQDPARALAVRARIAAKLPAPIPPPPERQPESALVAESSTAYCRVSEPAGDHLLLSIADERLAQVLDQPEIRIPERLLRRLTTEERDEIAFGMRLLAAAGRPARRAGISAICQTLEGVCRRLLRRRLDRELDPHRWRNGELGTLADAEDRQGLRAHLAEVLAQHDLAGVIPTHTLDANLPAVLSQARRRAGFSRAPEHLLNLGFWLAALTISLAAGDRRAAPALRALAPVLALRNQYAHGQGEGSPDDATQLLAEAEELVARL
jgi:hypothetical protein